jgi:hypothetical protein
MCGRARDGFPDDSEGTACLDVALPPTAAIASSPSLVTSGTAACTGWWVWKPSQVRSEPCSKKDASLSLSRETTSCTQRAPRFWPRSRQPSRCPAPFATSGFCCGWHSASSPAIALVELDVVTSIHSLEFARAPMQGSVCFLPLLEWILFRKQGAHEQDCRQAMGFASLKASRREELLAAITEECPASRLDCGGGRTCKPACRLRAPVALPIELSSVIPPLVRVPVIQESRILKITKPRRLTSSPAHATPRPVRVQESKQGWKHARVEY